VLLRPTPQAAPRSKLTTEFDDEEEISFSESGFDQPKYTKTPGELEREARPDPKPMFRPQPQPKNPLSQPKISPRPQPQPMPRPQSPVQSQTQNKPLSTSVKQDIIKEFQTVKGDTGSPEVQVALLTHRIERLTEHLKAPHIMIIIQDADFYQ
jgi:hypothetical protein